MEAPRKIYRTTFYLDNDRGKTVWKGHPVAGAENVEYIRKDAFIEKVCEWLESVNLDFYQIREGVFSRQLVEDFKKYMKGE